MLCISRSSNLVVPIRAQKPTYHPATGAVVDIKPAISVQFHRAVDIPTYAKEAVSKLADFGRGIGHREDPFTLCGIFDSVVAAEENNWDADDLKEVETALKRIAGHSFVIADRPRAPKPWPTYDAYEDVEEAEAAYAISKSVAEMGFSPHDVKAYEQENKSRPLVLEAMDAIIAEQEQDVLGVISA